MKKAILAVSAMALAFSIGGLASPWNKRTNLDVKETILIPGKQLPPGKYVMKLASSDSNRHIVQIFNEDESKVEATILAIPNSRLQPTGDTALTYWETPAGVPPALRSWFYPGDSFGQEFAYPKAVADQIAAANNNAKVPWYEGERTADYDESGLRETQVQGFDQSAVPEVAANTESAPSDTVAAAAPPAPEPVREEPAVTPAENPALAERRREAAAGIEPNPQPEPQLLAQNRAQEPPFESTPETLPQTATPYSNLLMAGIGLIALGGMLVSVRNS